MMRTALIAWDYPPSPSGLSTAAREIAESLVAEGCEVTVFSGDRTGTSMQDGVRIVGCDIPRQSWLGRVRTTAGFGHLAAPRRFRDAVLSAQAATPFDVVEATNWYAPAVLLTGRRDLPLVTRNSTPAAWSREGTQSLRNRFDGWAADLFERRQASGSAALISNTAEHGRRIADLYRLDGRRPHETIGLSLSQAVLQRAGAAGYPSGGVPLRLLFVGRAEPRKGFKELMDAVADVSRDADEGHVPDFRIDLLGVPEDDLPKRLRLRHAGASMRSGGNRMPCCSISTRPPMSLRHPRATKASALSTRRRSPSAAPFLRHPMIRVRASSSARPARACLRPQRMVVPSPRGCANC
jgi:glycosyltransferase involved in cell wall biosynthesis